MMFDFEYCALKQLFKSKCIYNLPMKASTGKTIRTDPDSPRTTVADWEGAVLKQGGVVIGKARTRGPNTRPTKEQVAVRYSPDVLAAFRATGAGWQTRMNDALRDWLRTHSPV
jgi:BrnA antitoxin of type II toxin-antitoxin system